MGVASRVKKRQALSGQAEILSVPQELGCTLLHGVSCLK